MEITEIQYMICSIVGEFQLKILMAEAVPKLFVQKLAFGSKHFWAQPLPKNLKAEISNNTTPIHILNFFVFSKTIDT